MAVAFKTMKTKMKSDFKNLITIFFFSLILIACGGGGGGGGNGGDANVTIKNSDQPKPSLTASAGPDQAGSVGIKVVLDGTQSTSDQIDSFEYAWSFSVKPPGSTAELKDANTANPTFTSDVAGDYVIKLTISSGEYKSEDTVVIKAYQPVANAGPNQIVTTNKKVQLDGSGSQYQGKETLYYYWVMVSKPEGSGAALFDNSVVNPTFIADVDGDYEISLYISNGIVNSNTDTVKITATTIPIANAGEDQTVSVGALVQLDATNSSSENSNDLTYAWKLKKRPLNSAAELSDSTAKAPTFTTDKAGQYEFELIVDNGAQKSPVDNVVITAQLPTADAGVDKTVSTNTTVQLDASASSDLSNLSMTLQWQILNKPAGSSAQLSDNTSVTPSFLADKDGDYILQLTVNNGTVDSAPDQIKITAMSPIAQAGSDQRVHTHDLVTLNGSNSKDSVGLPLTYLWQFISKPAGSNATLSDTTAVKPTFTADIDGDYELQLVVNNGNVNSAADSVKIKSTTAPIAVATAPALASVNQPVTLDSSQSSDVNNAQLAPTWKITSKPSGSLTTLSDQYAASPKITPDKAGDYKIQLVVNNAIEDSQPATVTISAALPVAAARWDYNVTPSTNIIFNSDNSKDYDDTTTALSYNWKITEQPLSSNASFADATLAAPEIALTTLGPYKICLTVNNTYVDSDPSCVDVNIRNSVGNNSGIFSMDFEDPAAVNFWGSTAQWEIGKPLSGPGIAYVGENVLATVLDGNYIDKTSALVSSQPINLPPLSTGETAIELSFWHWFSFYPGNANYPSNCNRGSPQDAGYVQIATNTTGTWDFQTVKTFVNSSDWTRSSIDLTSYAGQTIEIGFYLYNISTNSCTNGSRAGWYIDELLIDKH